MAIAFGTVTDGGVGPTFSHTVTGSNNILFVGVTGGISASNVTGVTYNSVAMTQVGTTQRRPSSRNESLWVLVAPATGANTVSVSISGGDIGGIVALSYSGVKQTGQPTGATGASGTAAGFADVITITDANSWAVLYAATGSPNSAGSGTTKRGAGGYDAFFDSGAATSAATYTLNVSFTSEGYGENGCAIAPFVASATVSPRKALLGVGQ